MTGTKPAASQCFFQLLDEAVFNPTVYKKSLHNHCDNCGLLADQNDAFFFFFF